MNFAQFIESGERNHWIREPGGLQMYVRKNAVWPGLIDVANVSARERGKGAYTSFVEKYDRLYPIFYENTLTERLAEWHRRLGHFEIPNDWDTPSWLNQLAVERRLGPWQKICPPLVLT